MNRTSLFLSIFAIFTLSIILTGFQCGSTDMTSAKLYLQRNDYVNAEKSLQKEVNKNPVNGEAWYYLGFCQLQNKNFSTMLTSFDASLKNTNEFADKIRLGKLSAWGQLFNEGIGYHGMINKVTKDSMRIIGKQALDTYTMAVKCVPDSPSTYQNIAAVYALLGNFDEEIANLKLVREKSKGKSNSRDIINAYLQKAEALKEKNDNDGANEAYNQALAEIGETRKADPGNNELLSLMIDLYIQLGRAKEALPFIEEGVQKDPSNKNLQYNLGYLRLQSDNLPGAIEAFNSSIAADSSFQDAYRNLGVAYMKLAEQMKKEAEAKADPKKSGKDMDKSYLDKFKLAAKVFEKLVTIKSDDPNFWDALTTAYVNAGMIKEAQKAAAESDKLRKK